MRRWMCPGTLAISGVPHTRVLRVGTFPRSSTPVPALRAVAPTPGAHPSLFGSRSAGGATHVSPVRKRRVRQAKSNRAPEATHVQPHSNNRSHHESHCHPEFSRDPLFAFRFRLLLF